MTFPHNKPKPWWPRFSVRALAIVVTLVCCYAACWGPTKTSGVEDVVRYVLDGLGEDADEYERILAAMREFVLGWDATATMPLVVGITADGVRHYYFWFFGYVSKLPYERDVPPASPQL